jgi:hypothetical protein
MSGRMNLADLVLAIGQYLNTPNLEEMSTYKILIWSQTLNWWTNKVELYIDFKRKYIIFIDNKGYPVHLGDSERPMGNQVFFPMNTN